MSRVVVVDHRRIDELLFAYQFPIARFVAWVFAVIREYYFVVSVLFDMFLVNSVLEVAPLVGFPLCMKPVFLIRVRFPIVNGLGRIVLFRGCLRCRR